MIANMRARFSVCVLNIKQYQISAGVSATRNHGIHDVYQANVSHAVEVMKNNKGDSAHSRVATESNT